MRIAPSPAPGAALRGDAFAVDASGQIVGWGHDAERLLGYRRDEALGQPCCELLRCRDGKGRRLEPGHCPIIRAGLAHGPPLPLDVVVHHRDGSPVPVAASAAPSGARGGDGCAVVALRPAAWAIARAPAGDLATTLDRLLVATGADAAEVFLAAPVGGELVLVAHRGLAPRAFRELTRFGRSQGFPGLVVATREPLVSLDLPHDDRYLRPLVKRQGFISYLCAPVQGAADVLGSLHVAYRRPDAGVVQHLPLLTQVAVDLGRELELARLRAAEPLARHLLDPGADVLTNQQRLLDLALHALVEAAEADHGVVLALDDRGRALEPLAQWRLPDRLRRALATPGDAGACPSLARERCLIGAEPARAESPLCRAALRDLPAALCLPLVAGGRALGVALLGSERRDPLPARHLSLTHAALGGLAVALHNARVSLQQAALAQQLARSTPAPSGGAPGRPPSIPAGVAGAATAGSSPASPFLDLRCLGDFTIVRDGRAVPRERFTRRRALTLLKILLTRYGKPIHREELAGLLWPDVGPTSANGLLSVAVHSLRRGLEPDAPPGQTSSFIQTDGDRYRFNPNSPHRLDSHEFQACADLGGQLEAAGRCAEALDAFGRAIALYAGDFLEDEPYSDWCALEREYLRERFLTVLRRAGRLRLARGDTDVAVTCFRRALQVDSTLEDVHRSLMEALWRAGQRDAALRQYGECRAILERELGVAPMPETRALQQQIAVGA